MPAAQRRYPVENWDVLVLVRWFTILGGVTAGVGFVLAAREIFNVVRLTEALLVFATVGLILLASWMRRARGLDKSATAVEMMSGFALQGLTFALAIDFSSGSNNWPALVGVQALLLTALAYLLQNRLILIHAAVCFFIFFGGETGYVSGWSAYWLKMNYPVRYVAAGLLFLAVAWAHAYFRRGAYQSFARVYAHLGLLIIHLALWFLSLFGYFEEQITWDNNTVQRVAFSALWAVVSLVCIGLAGVTGQRMLRGYGLTFLIINVYTLYCQFVIGNSVEWWWFHLILVGGSLVGLGTWLERRLRRPDTKPNPDEPLPDSV